MERADVNVRELLYRLQIIIGSNFLFLNLSSLSCFVQFVVLKCYDFYFVNFFVEKLIENENENV